jgi:hypothetical protein
VGHLPSVSNYWQHNLREPHRSLAPQRVVTSMSRDCISASDFINRLRHICQSEGADSLVLNVDDSKTWPHFCISCKRENAAIVRGYYVENGESFWQISESGREVFTGDASSSEAFLEDVHAVIHILVTSGCTETKWKRKNGRLVRSLICIRANGKEMIFGKPPSFWQRMLVKEQRAFVPCP